MPQGSGKTASGKLIPALLITWSVGDGYRFSLADRGAYTGVIASWLNTRKPKKKDEVKVKRKRKTKKKSPEKIKKPDEPQGDYLVGDEGNVLTLSHTYANKNNAERAAKAAWEKCSAALHRCLSSWQKAGRIFTRKCRLKFRDLSRKLTAQNGY